MPNYDEDGRIIRYDKEDDFDPDNVEYCRSSRRQDMERLIAEATTQVNLPMGETVVEKSIRAAERMAALVLHFTDDDESVFNQIKGVSIQECATRMNNAAELCDDPDLRWLIGLILLVIEMYDKED